MKYIDEKNKTYLECQICLMQVTEEENAADLHRHENDPLSVYAKNPDLRRPIDSAIARGLDAFGSYGNVVIIADKGSPLSAP
jgi:hypothetical protein